MLIEAEAAFLSLDKERNNPELLNQIFRIAHNLKGTSQAVGFDQMAALTHVAENLILKIQNSEVETTDSVVSLLLEFNDMVVKMIEGLKDDLSATFQIEDIVEKLNKAVNGELSNTETDQQHTTPPSSNDDRFEEMTAPAKSQLDSQITTEQVQKWRRL